MNDAGIEENFELNGRICSEAYSCVEDLFYFVNLALPFAN
jgi:hypothetical protein